REAVRELLEGVFDGYASHERLRSLGTLGSRRLGVEARKSMVIWSSTRAQSRPTAPWRTRRTDTGPTGPADAARAAPTPPLYSASPVAGAHGRTRGVTPGTATAARR